MRAHTPHPRAPNPEQTARQKTCWLAHSPKVTESRTSLASPFGACRAPERRGDPARPPKSHPGPPGDPPDEMRPRGRPWCAVGGRGHSAHGAHYIEAFNGMGRCLPHPKTQKHGPFRTPRSTQKAVVTLVLRFRPGAGV